MNLFDGKIVTVKYVTQKMLDWLEESNIKYHITPHLERWKYSGPKIDTDMEVMVGPNDDSDFRRTGDDILFDKEEDRMHFQLRWAEDITTGENSLGF